MNKVDAYFDYAPVGPSLLVVEKNGEHIETELDIQSNADLIPTLCSLFTAHGVTHLYCNKPAFGLADKIKEHFLTQYNYSNLEISQYC